MVEPTFRSDIRVVLNPDATVGGDNVVARAARVQPPGTVVLNPERVINACLPLKHNTPFEHSLFSVYAELPGVVWWQLTRQRFMALDTEDLSFSLESGRYKHLDPEFYVPPPNRPCLEPDGFRPMRPALTDGGAPQVGISVRRAVSACWEEYTALIGAGVAREVARLVLPNWSLYCDGYVTARPLSWLQFFSKRRATPDTTTPTFPQWEIEEFARQCEAMFAERWPLTYAAFMRAGRAAP